MNRLLTWLPWALLTVACLAFLWRALSRSAEPSKLAGRWLLTVIIVSLMWFGAAKALGSGGGGNLLGNYALALIIAGAIAAGGVILGIIWGPSIGELLARPIAGLFDDGGAELKPSPLYSSALAHRKQGRHEEAIAAIQRQLTQFPGDFPGTLLWAAIQAQDLHDLAAAEITLSPWIHGSHTDPGQQAIARTKLADWHLEVSKDTDRARELLSSIVTQLPDSDAAFLAEQRLAHLDYEAQPRSGPIHLESGAGRPIDVGVPPPVLAKSDEPEATHLVDHLQQHPHDVAARERLAILYAWTFQRPDLAREQLQTLIGFRQASPREVTHWLNLLADLEIQVARDVERARAALDQLISRNPTGAAAEQARTRILFLSRELKRHQRPPVMRSTPVGPMPRAP